MWPLLAAGQVTPIVHGTLPLTQAAEAHRLLEAGAVIGKLVLLTELAGRSRGRIHLMLVASRQSRESSHSPSARDRLR